MTQARRIIVTGGGSGLGAEIVSALVASGFDVEFTYRRSAVDADALVQNLNTRHPERTVKAVALDLSDRQSVEDYAEDIAETEPFGLVHNAGQSYDALAAMLSQDKAEAAMQVNFWSFTRLVKSTVRPMMGARPRRIIAIGSVAALHGNPGNAAYGASKGALISYCKTLAMETARRGITVNVVAPGMIDTAMMAPYQDHREKMEAQIPAGRFAKAREIASIVAFLAGPDAGYITGTVIPVDGGLTASLGIHR